MRVHNNEPAIIFSAWQQDMPKSLNHANHATVLTFLRNNKVPHRQLVGCDKGRKELSVMIPARKARIANTFGKLYRQSYFLELDNERGAWFTDVKTGEKTFAGWFIPVTKESALQEKSWTLDEGNQYWIISDVKLGTHFQR